MRAATSLAGRRPLQQIPRHGPARHAGRTPDQLRHSGTGWPFLAVLSAQARRLLVLDGRAVTQCAALLLSGAGRDQ
jgi:hypothetical protein